MRGFVRSRTLGKMLIEKEWARAFAEDWIDAWNAGDLERILGHYVDGFEMASPFIRERLHVESGRLAGKEQIRTYWQKSLSTTPSLRFELLDVFSGMDVVAILYRNFTRDRVVIERMRFNQDGRVYEAEALHSIGAGAPGLSTAAPGHGPGGAG